jgi:hypothetical protein
MTQKANSFKLNLDAPFVLARTTNGGYTLEQVAIGHPFAAPGQSPNKPELIAAFSSASDLLLALSEALNPPEPVSEVISETPPFEATNEPNEWMPMHTAPRTGVFVRIEDEDGFRHRPMKFTQPGWWDAPNGELRLADPMGNSEFTQGVLRAAKWRPLSAGEDAQYNGRKPSAVKSAPLPAAFR